MRSDDDPFHDCEFGPDAVLGTRPFHEARFADIKKRDPIWRSSCIETHC